MRKDIKFTWMVFILIMIYQLIKLPTIEYKLIYTLLIGLFSIAISYESEIIGCNLDSCSLSQNISEIDLENFICDESSRVNWRRAYIVVFIPFILFNIFMLPLFQYSLIYLFISWSLLYFYFNFDQYHRSSLACKQMQVDQ